MIHSRTHVVRTYTSMHADALQVVKEDALMLNLNTVVTEREL